MKLKKLLILTMVLFLILVPVGALKIDTSANSCKEISSVKIVQNTLNVIVHANKYYNGKLNVKNAKTYTIINKPKNGQLTLNKNGEFIYKPNKNFVGQDNFEYKVFNSNKNANVCTVNIKVINNPPVTKNICINTHANVQYKGELDGKDVDKDTLTYRIAYNSKNGTIKLNSDGRYIYTPKANFTGVDSFNYIANDGIKDSEISNVTINIINNPPVSKDLSVELHCNLKYNGKLNGTDIDGDNLTYITSKPSNGLLHVDPNGTFTYIPNTNFLGADSFIYRVNDGCNDSKNATVTLNITNSPSISNNMQLKIPANMPYDGKLNGTDVDQDILTYYNIVSPSNGILKLNSDGNFVYIPNNGFVGADNFSYIVSDGISYSNVGNVTVNVVNNPPVANYLNISTMGNTPYNGKLNVTDIDPDRITYDCIDYPSNGTLSTNPDGKFCYIPNKGFVGVDSFIYIANDGTDYSNVAKVTINVKNNPPVANDMTYKITFQTFDRGGFSGKLNGSDFDGNPLTYTLLTKPFCAIDLRLKSNGNFQYISGIRYEGVENFTYKVNDGYVDSNIGTVKIESSVW